MSHYAANAYANVEKITTSGRQLEAAALFRVARSLQVAQEAWGTPGFEAKVDDALKLNQRLWTFFQAELDAPECPVPADLKANLLRLSTYVDRRIFEVMAFPSADKLTILININRNIAAGLSAGAEVGAGV